MARINQIPTLTSLSQCARRLALVKELNLVGLADQQSLLKPIWKGTHRLPRIPITLSMDLGSDPSGEITLNHLDARCDMARLKPYLAGPHMSSASVVFTDIGILAQKFVARF